MVILVTGSLRNYSSDLNAVFFNDKEYIVERFFGLISIP